MVEKKLIDLFSNKVLSTCYIFKPLAVCKWTLLIITIPERNLNYYLTNDDGSSREFDTLKSAKSIANNIGFNEDH